MRMWGPLLTYRVQAWQQFLHSCAQHWMGPPLGPALGPQMGGPPRLWESLSTSTVQSWLQFLQPCAHPWLVPPLWPLLTSRFHQLPLCPQMQTIL